MNNIVYRIYKDDEFVGGIHADKYELIDEGALEHKPHNIKIFDCNGVRVANFYSRDNIKIRFFNADDEKEYYDVYIY